MTKKAQFVAALQNSHTEHKNIKISLTMTQRNWFFIQSKQSVPGLRERMQTRKTLVRKASVSNFIQKGTYVSTLFNDCFTLFQRNITTLF